MNPQAAERARRARVAAWLAATYSGVVHRRDLRAHGIDRFGVRTEIAAGRWTPAGRHTLVIGGREPVGTGVLWRAVREAGPGAVLDGAAALVVAGMSGFRPDLIDVWVSPVHDAHPITGVRIHRYRRALPVVRGGVPRVSPEWATVHAAQWAVSDRQAALLVCLPVQQRIVATHRLLDTWREVQRSPRRVVLDGIVRDVCDGAHSLGELDFGWWCRRYGLPQPRRQVVRRVDGRRCYLDVEFDGLVVEIDGGQHLAGLSPLHDALRSNALVLQHERVLRLPLVGLRLDPDAFMGQVATGLGVLPLTARQSVRPHARSA